MNRNNNNNNNTKVRTFYMYIFTIIIKSLHKTLIMNDKKNILSLKKKKIFFFIPGICRVCFLHI